MRPLTVDIGLILNCVDTSRSRQCQQDENIFATHCVFYVKIVSQLLLRYTLYDSCLITDGKSCKGSALYSYISSIIILSPTKKFAPNAALFTSFSYEGSASNLEVVVIIYVKQTMQ